MTERAAEVFGLPCFATVLRPLWSRLGLMGLRHGEHEPRSRSGFLGSGPSASLVVLPRPSADVVSFAYSSCGPSHPASGSASTWLASHS